jgi:hypothetical protein
MERTGTVLVDNATGADTRPIVCAGCGRVAVGDVIIAARSNTDTGQMKK